MLGNGIEENIGSCLTNDLADFINAKYTSLEGRQVSKYVDSKFGGDVESAITFLATKGNDKARSITRALVTYQSEKDKIKKAPKVEMENVEPIKHVKVAPKRKEEPTGYAKFERMCEKANVSLKYAKCSPENLPIVKMPVERGFPQFPNKKVIIPKKFLNERIVNSLWGAESAELKIIDSTKNKIFAIPEAIHQKPKPKRETFIAVVKVAERGIRVTAPGRNKRITVPREHMSKLLVDGGAWKMEKIHEGRDFIYSKPVERVTKDEPDQFASKMNALRNGEKVTL